MKQVVLTDLIKVLNELQDMCEFEPQIVTEGQSYTDLVEILKEAIESLMPQDELSEFAVGVINELGFELPKSDGLRFNDDWLREARSLNEKKLKPGSE